MKRDWLPLLLLPALGVAAFPFVGSASSWMTLTVAGLAMGLMIFIMASGLTLTFGLMDVLNFGHGAFIAVGAFVAASVMLALGPWMAASSAGLNLSAVGIAILAAMAVSGVLGWAFERIVVRPVYGQHLKQILITTGGLIVAEQLLKVIWGPEQITLTRPEALRGAFLLGDIAVEKYRVLAVVIGLAVFAALSLTLNRTRIGLLIRAGVEKLGLKFSDIRILVINHAHWDHDAGSATIKRLTGASYAVMDGDVAVVQTGGEADFHYGGNPVLRYAPATVDRVLHDGDQVSLGGMTLVAHRTPGHTKGNTTWTMRVTDLGKAYEVVIVGSWNVMPSARMRRR